jgi:carotenoid cleavage dioxygenase
MVTPSLNPYLEGNFSPVKTEIAVDSLETIGKIPEELNGLYVRNGPNPHHQPLNSYHWFDGDGMIHGVQFHNGAASYVNRYVNTECLVKEREAGRSLWHGLAGRPNIRQLLFPPCGIRQKNPANTGLVWHAGKLLALWEVGAPYQVSVPDLKTLGPLDYGLPVKSFTAHPKIDPVRNEMRFFGMSLGRYPTLQYGVIDQHDQLKHSAHIYLPNNTFMHDFAITRDFTIFLDLPYDFSLKTMVMKGIPFEFHHDRASRFGIMPRLGKANNIKWFEDDPCFIYHTLNAFESHDEDGNVEVILQACRMPKGVLGSSAESQIVDDDVGRLHQWTFNLSTGNVSSEALDDRPCDMPRVNDALLGTQTRYGYTSEVFMGSVHGSPLFTGVTKHDFKYGASSQFQFGQDCFGGESVFVQRTSSSTSDDDGWLINIVYNAQSKTSEVVIIDALSLDAVPVARVPLPQRVPFGFHGTWVPG